LELLRFLGNKIKKELCAFHHIVYLFSYSPEMERNFLELWQKKTITKHQQVSPPQKCDDLSI